MKANRHLLTCLLLLLAIVSYAQETNYEDIPKKRYDTQQITGELPIIDGLINDPAWDKVEWGTGFREQRPRDGAKAVLETSFKILYDDKNLYVAFRAHDPSPDSIVSRMSRRDGFEGDWVEINIDSYHDLRTGFSFTASVSGVKGDEFISNNGNNWDTSWNPIWYLKTNIDEEGWTAEIRIPLSQLRYSNEEEQVWGIQVTRRNFRNGSRSRWQYIPQNAPFFVSGFGELHGIKGIKPQKQVELQPYVLAQGERTEAVEGNPFQTGFDRRFAAGLDGKIGVTGDLVLDFTINPDFGQVDADPSQLNLDGFEIFFSERRPFFVENNNIFDYRITGSEAGGSYDFDNLFYSRRIGGRPHAYPNLGNDEYANVPQNSTILGAAKFSGKTKKGTAIGILESITQEEHAEIDLFGERRKEVVEPLTSYFVGRVQQDIKEGNTIVGGILTATNRRLDGTNMEDMLRKNAYTGGVDFVHRWNNRNWQLQGNFIASQVEGSTEAITATQTDFTHYFDRPGATHLSVDEEATSLTGTGGNLALAKYGGKWRFQTGATWRSPGLEINDVGFMQNADEINQYLWAGFVENQQGKHLNSWRININEWSRWDFSGLHLHQSFNTNGHVQFKNFWGGGTGINVEVKDLSTRALFGGPVLRRPNGFGNFFYLYSDGRKKATLNINGFWGRGGIDQVKVHNLGIWMRFQPSNRWSVSLGPNFSHRFRQYQHVATLETQKGTQYFGGSIDQQTLSMTARLNYNITPNLTVQYYGQPFISRGRYMDFKEVTNPLGKNSERFELLGNRLIYDEIDEYFTLDQNVDGVEDCEGCGFGKPDFNFMQFNSNLVVRWEYVPGSELFVVWSQGVTNFGDPQAGLVQSLSEDLFDENTRNIFLVKWTYRFLL